MLINLRLMDNYSCILLHINNMAKCTAGGGRVAASRHIATSVSMWERDFLYTSTCDISHHWRRTEGIKWSKNTWTLIILDMPVLVARRDCEIISLSFSHLAACTALYGNTVTMLFLECAVNNTKTLPTSLAADDFISQYKLFIILRSEKVILT